VFRPVWLKGLWESEKFTPGRGFKGRGGWESVF